jgi:hypothetical protein
VARTVIGLSLLALAVRLAFLTWGTNPGSADGIAYDMLARSILDGHGYTNLDGSAALKWVPGWPALMAALYATFGADPAVVMAANAVFGAAAAGVMTLLGAALFGARVGAVTGLLYALWPGLVYYVATLHSEPLCWGCAPW